MPILIPCVRAAFEPSVNQTVFSAMVLPCLGAAPVLLLQVSRTFVCLLLQTRCKAVDDIQDTHGVRKHRVSKGTAKARDWPMGGTFNQSHNFAVSPHLPTSSPHRRHHKL